MWFNGEFVHETHVPMTAHSLHYGGAVYEGIRFYRTSNNGRAVFRLEDHLNRLLGSARVMEMECPFPISALKQAALELIRRSGLTEGYVRPIIFNGEGLGLCADHLPVNTGIVVLPWLQRVEPLRLMQSSWIRMHPASSVVEAKIAGHYVNSRLAALEAKKAGADDALLLDFEGNVAETSVANIFIVKKGKVFTPARGNIFSGITRSSLLQLSAQYSVSVTEKKVSLLEAQSCDAMFVVGTACEVLAVSAFGERELDISNQLLLLCQELYQKAVHGLIPFRLQWLTYVD